MSSNQPMSQRTVAPTPMNTPASAGASVLAKPTIPASVAEGDEAAEEIPRLTREDVIGNPVFASMVEGKLQHLLGRSSGYIESLPVAVRNRIDGLQGIQVEQAKIEAEFQKEMLELEKRFAKRYAPLYEQRAKIVAGLEEPTDSLVDAGRQVDEEDEDDDDEDDDETKEPTVARPKPTQADLESSPKGIPEFWLTALNNHMGISDLITDRDEAVLKFLEDIRVEYLDGRPGFKLIFAFGPGAQEYFSQSTLEKTYIYQDEVGYEGDLVYDHAEGTAIDWKEGKNLTQKVESKKQRNKNTNQTRIVKKTVPTESFFSFFSPPDPNAEADDEDEDEELANKLELDYQIGEDIKERIIPRAVDYFTGKALRFAGEGFEESDDEFSEFDDEDDDDDEDAPPRPRKYNPPPSGVTPASNQDPAECKQQ